MLTMLFLMEHCKKKVSMEQPLGYIKEEGTGLVCKLNKAIYGLKQAPRLWFEKLKVNTGQAKVQCLKV